MGAVASLAPAFRWPVLFVPWLTFGVSLYLGLVLNRRRTGLALGVVGLSLYLPFFWVVPIHEPWDDYRLTWLNFWPALPGILAAAFVPGPFQEARFAAGAVMAMVLLASLTWLGTKGRVGLLAATVLALLASVPQSWIAYQLFLF
ncbi:MAG: hypothetical protein U0835_25595 [Isosphaeraceae bacterium]